MTTRHPVLSSLSEEKRLEIIQQARKSPWLIVTMGLFGAFWAAFVIFSDIENAASGLTKWILYDFMYAVAPGILGGVVAVWIERPVITKLVEKEKQRA